MLVKNLILLICLGTASVSFGQTNKFEIGVETGPGIFSMRSNSYSNLNYNATLGFLGGFYFQSNISKIISVRTIVAYERKGYMTTGAVTDQFGNNTGDYKVLYNFDYITIPILLRATFGEKIKFFGNAGPYLGYLIKETIAIEMAGQSTTSMSYSPGIRYQFSDAGISFGAGISIPVKQQFAVSFEVRDNLGLYTISNPVYYSFNYSLIKTNSTNFLIGIAYQFGQRPVSK